MVADVMHEDIIINVMTAYKEGKRIEFRGKHESGLKWQRTDNPKWDWYNYEYRVAAETTELDAEDDAVGLFIARDKNGGLRMFTRKPQRFIDSMWTEVMWNHASSMELDRRMFPDLKWEDEPCKVNIVPENISTRNPDGSYMLMATFNHDFEVGDLVYYHNRTTDTVECMKVYAVESDKYISFDGNKDMFGEHVPVSVRKENAFSLDDAHFLDKHKLFGCIEGKSLKFDIDPYKSKI